MVMRRCVQSMIITPAPPLPPGVDATPFSPDIRLWRLHVQKKIPRRSLMMQRVAEIFSVAQNELQKLPVVDEVADSHIIRAAHMVRWHNLWNIVFLLPLLPLTISFFVAFDFRSCDFRVAGQRFHICSASEKGRPNQQPRILNGTFAFLTSALLSSLSQKQIEKTHLSHSLSGPFTHHLRHKIRSDCNPHAVRLHR
jgi:hypothetical protein